MSHRLLTTRAAPNGRHRRPGILSAVALLAALAVVSPATPAFAANHGGGAPGLAPDTTETERSLTTPVPSLFLPYVSQAQINAYLDNGWRLSDIEVLSVSPYRFTAVLIRNIGAYNTAWWWYFGITDADLVANTQTNHARPIDIEAYYVGGNVRYAVIMVDNQGGNYKNWKWYFGTPAFIAGKVDQFQGRIVDLDKHPVSSWFSALMLKNTGPDAKSWWYLYDATVGQIAALINRNHARLIDLEPAGPGHFHAVFVRSQGEYWWWYVGVSSVALANLAAQNGARLIDVERYWTGTHYDYLGIMLNNVNSLTTRVREAMRGPMQGTKWGFYLKRVDGPVLAALQETAPFEPASMIKALHELHALRQVRARHDSLSNPVTWYLRPGDAAHHPSDPDYADDKNKCAYTDAGVLQTSNTVMDSLSVVLSQMMKYSDNRATDGILRRYGFTAINDTAHNVVHMNATQLNHRVGCPSASSPQPFKSNVLTLVDAGRLWEGVADGTLLGKGFFRQEMFDLAYNNKNGFKPWVDEAAMDLGKSQATADLFFSQIKYAAKGGSYTNGADCAPDTCELARRTSGGWFALPYKVSGHTAYHEYVYGRFIDGVVNCGADDDCTDEYAAMGDASTAAGKMLEIGEIKAALATFP